MTSAMPSAEPPHMMDRVPALAPRSPPVTGASTEWTPFAAAFSAICTARVGVEVVMSTIAPPSLRFASTPSGPRITDSTSLGYPTAGGGHGCGARVSLAPGGLGR